MEGDTTITDGVSVISTPGHTKGGQSVCVRTDKGTAIISGICGIWENYEPQLVGKDLPVIPPAPHYHLLQAYDSMLKIKEMAEILIPNHDIKYLDVDSIP